MSQIAYIIQGPVTDGTIILTDNISPAYERGYISVVFYSDDFITTVLPTAGTLIFKGSETGERYGTFKKGTVDVTTEDYDRPSFTASLKKIKATALGIVGNGALNYRAIISMYTNGN